MTYGVMVGWRVHAEEYEKFLSFVESERGDRERYAAFLIENAMREYIDEDDAHALEEMVNQAITAGGYTLGDPGQEKKFGDDPETLRGGDTTLVNRLIDPDLRERFMAYVKENTEFGTSYGLALSYALREYRQNNRTERTTEKYRRVSEDITQLMSEFGTGDAAGNLSTIEKRTVAMVRTLHDMYEIGEETLTRYDIHRSIAAVSPTAERGEPVSDHLDETYRERIVERIEYEPSAENEKMYVPIEDAEEQRREETAEEMDALMAGRAVTDGGIE